jgi:hypothetical protein
MSQSQYHVSKYIHANIFVILFLFFKTIIFVILVIWRQITLNQIINNAIYHKYRYVEVFLAFVLTKQNIFLLTIGLYLISDRKGISSIYLKVVITIWLTVTKYPHLKWQWIFSFLRRGFLSSITAKIFTGLGCIWVTRQVSYMKQELLTLREYLWSPLDVWWGSCCSSF